MTNFKQEKKTKLGFDDLRKRKQIYYAVALLLLWFVIWCAVKLKWINGI